MESFENLKEEEEDEDEYLYSEEGYKKIIESILENKKKSKQKLEEIVRDLIEMEDFQEINKLIKFIERKFVRSSFFQEKKVGFHAISVVSAEITKEMIPEAERYLRISLFPIVDCLKDNDPRVRFSALEAVYYIIEAFGEISLIALNEVFLGVINSLADYDEEVKKAALTLDRSLQSLVETYFSSTYLNIEQFMPQFYKSFKVLNPEIKLALLNWLNLFYTNTNLNVLVYLPLLLEYLVEMLNDHNKEITRLAAKCLKNISNELCLDSEALSVTIYDEIIRILLGFLDSERTTSVKQTAMDFLYDLLAVVSQEQTKLEARNLKQIPDEMYSIEYSTKGEDLADESSLKIAIISQYPKIIAATLLIISNEDDLLKSAGGKVNALLMEHIRKQISHKINYNLIFSLLRDLVEEKKVETCAYALDWLHFLIKAFSKENLYFPQMEITLPKILEKLECHDMMVINRLLDILETISERKEHLNLTIVNILKIFHAHRDIIHSRMQIIIKKLSKRWSFDKIFIKFVKSLKQFGERGFISNVVKALEIILMTYKEAYLMRQTLRVTSEEYFYKLFDVWSNNTISSITLCLISQKYELAYRILLHISDNEIRLDQMKQLKKLIYLLETPAFTFIRLQLLECHLQPFLFQALHGILQIIRHGKAFKILKKRLQLADFSGDISSECGAAVMADAGKSNSNWIEAYMVLFIENQKKSTKSPRKTSL